MNLLHHRIAFRFPVALRADGARITLEESIYLGGLEPRRSEQVVLTGFADGPQQVKWAISKVG